MASAPGFQYSVLIWTTDMIPPWNPQGVLPPVRPGAYDTDPDRSPYRVPVDHFVERFASSAARAEILQGFLDHRAALHQAGIITGYQWLDGSFAEDIEGLELRPPNDLDVVTFYPFVDAQREQELLTEFPHVFDSQYSKDAFRIDAYFYPIGVASTRSMIRWIVYWYSMWSHRRSMTGRSVRRRGSSRSGFSRVNLWKGFLEVDLLPNRDACARNLLELMIQERGWR